MFYAESESPLSIILARLRDLKTFETCATFFSKVFLQIGIFYVKSICNCIKNVLSYK